MQCLCYLTLIVHHYNEPIFSLIIFFLCLLLFETNAFSLLTHLPLNFSLVTKSALLTSFLLWWGVLHSIEMYGKFLENVFQLYLLTLSKVMSSIIASLIQVSTSRALLVSSLTLVEVKNFIKPSRIAPSFISVDLIFTKFQVLKVNTSSMSLTSFSMLWNFWCQS